LCYPLSVLLHQCSMHIHSSITDACNVSNSLSYSVRLFKKGKKRTCGINICSFFCTDVVLPAGSDRGNQ